MRRAAEPGAAPSDKRDTRVKRALASPLYMGEAYFAPYDPNWTELLPEFARAMLRFAHSARPWPQVGGVIMLPPEFLKTTLLSQVYPLWLTYRASYFGQLLRGMLLSEEEGMAKGNLAVISWHILNNEELQRDFVGPDGGPLVFPDPQVGIWRDDSIVVNRPNVVSRDPTWQAKGLDSKGKHGRRLDVVIGDDVVTPRNSGSPAMRKSALDAIELEVQTRVVEGGQFLVAGNFNDSKDLLSTLATRARWQMFKRPSMHVAGEPSMAPKESEFDTAALTWPANWNRSRLLTEHRDAPNRFRRIHLLDPRAEHGDRLNTGWVTRVAEELGAALLRYAKFFIAVDPAPGGDTADLDFFNVSVGALTSGHLDLVQSLDVRAPLPRQAELVGILHDSYARLGFGVTAIGGAKIAMDRYFRGGLGMVRPDLKHKIEEISVPGDKETRLEGLGPYAQSGWFRVWEPVWTALTSSPADQPQELSFEEQWREFPYGNHDDKLDGADLLIRTAEEFAVVGDVEWSMEAVEV